MSQDAPRPVAVVTGASSGIGAATARRLAADGFDVVLGARRTDRIAAIADEIGGRAHALDVTDEASVAAFAASVGPCAVLVNNAGGASGLEPIADADLERWRAMYEVNVLGLARVTQALLPALEASGDGRIVNVGSISAFETYPGGAGYTGTKHAVDALNRTLRLELLGRPVRVIEIDPGAVETEFSVVRFDGDEDRAAEVYRGMTPLEADDVADVIAFAVTRPAHVSLDRIVLRPRDQATARDIHRRDDA
ncbi:SDR family NAD(P)-dependent oxidoreductase [Patulibacter brassicae]|uniref:SDR family NAD(P)-dependent oxidoreductase n=1 Tax=Patulibacter brassicae TaxID=1705717 RepID=A0ABU4VLT3_9ACTN|nr:SDR family NAD(P)-dependent oxidoreductase [Patulibacter brassicae]MDX8152788.1 SDR family NAD(P)-dependent oxidoreductase [Patulibacter brassicae]